MEKDEREAIRQTIRSLKDLLKQDPLKLRDSFLYALTAFQDDVDLEILDPVDDTAYKREA